MKKIFVFAYLSFTTFFLKAQNVGIGTTTPKADFNVAAGKTVLFGPDVTGEGSKLIWHPTKAAFRAGYVSNANWNTDSIGNFSFASGYDSKATAYTSIAMGEYANATQDYAIAIGRYATATNYSSVSIGEKNTASGGFAVAMGLFTKASGDGAASFGIGSMAKAIGGFTTGIYNDTLDNPINGIPIGADRMFQIGNGSETARSNALTVLRNGNVGIGITDPNVPLHIKSVNNNPLIIDGGNQLYVTLAENGNNVGYIGSWTGNANDVELGTYGGNTTGSVILSTNNTAKLTVNNNGNVAIGTGTASEKLEVAGKIKTTSLQITNGAANGNILTSDADGNANWTAPIAVPNYWTANGANIYKNNTGNVGIGTNTPATAKLVIGGGSAQEGLDLATADQYANLRVLRNSLHPTDKDMFIGFESGAISSLHLYSNNNETVTVSGNKVGIGNTNPSSKLQVDGAIRVQGGQTTHAQGLSLEWNNTGGSGASYLLNQKGLGSGGFVLGEVDVNNNITHRLDIDNNGNVGINNATPKSTLEVTGSFATRVQYKTGSSGAISLDNTATVWIFNSNIGASIVLPSSFDCPNRRYTIANRNNAAITISSYFNLSNVAVTTIPAFSSVEVVSGGGSWEQIK